MGTDEGRVALVTGGGRGIGRAISLALAAEGFDVAVNYRKNDEAAKATVAEIEGMGRRAVPFQASVDSYDEDAAMVDAVVAAFGGLDVLVHNAGVSNRGRTVADTDLDDLHRVMGTHALGGHHLAKLTVPHLRRRGGGHVVFVSSQSTVSFDPNAGPYNMAKAALEALAWTLAKEEARHGIRVNVVAPSLVNTEMGRRVVKGVFGVDDVHAVDGKVPLGRVVEPTDVAEVVRFLVSGRAGMVTGQRLAVDGGGLRP
jgi:NAD(P)-dependent dehydrogenase (short-subunit alcohol dehydrogenase family)